LDPDFIDLKMDFQKKMKIKYKKIIPENGQKIFCKIFENKPKYYKYCK